ncbi:MAG: TIGR04282 family arsenosugar biosynthesis glycosyltransferase [Desulfobacteraceae bacterium]
MSNTPSLFQSQRYPTIVPTRVPDKVLFYWPPKQRSMLEQWLGPTFDFAPQRGDDLGEKMANAFEELFQKGFDGVLLMGSDIPELDSRIISAAEELLESVDAVIGPASDGGYYLMGLRSHVFSRKLFQHIAWSTGEVLTQTLKTMEALFIEYRQLPVLDDIDTPKDFRRLKKRVEQGGNIGRRTRKNIQAHDAGNTAL